MSLTLGSFFSGIGGLELGLERAGFRCLWQVEIDPFASKVLAKHWPEVKRHGDITKLNGSELEPVDAICGGFPCQDLSQAGKRAGIEGTRSGLWFEYARLIGILRPRYVVIENVPGLLVPGAMSRVVGELARLGYVGVWRSIRASEFGAAHLRKRVFIVAHADRERFGEDRKFRSAAVTGIGGLGHDVANHACDIGRREQISLSGGSIPAGAGSSCAADVANAELSGTRAGFGESERIERLRWQRSRNGCLEALANGESRGRRELRESSGGDGFSDGCDEALANAGNGFVPQSGRRSEGRNGPGSTSAILSDTTGSGRQDGEGREERTGSQPVIGHCGPFAPGPSDPRWPAILEQRPDLAPALESPIRGMADGVPSDLDRALSNRTKRLSRLGNAVVPQIAEWIGRRILEHEGNGA